MKKDFDAGLGLGIMEAPRMIDRAALQAVGEMSDEAAAALLDGRIRSIDAILRTAFSELGYICSVYQDRQLWQCVQKLNNSPCTSFNDWLVDACPYGRTHCYAAMGIYRELVKDIPHENLLGITETNARVLVQISSAERPKLVEAAKVMGGDEFVAHVQREAPGQHLERNKALVFHPSESAYAVAVRVLDRVGALMDIPDRDGQFEALLIDWEQEHGE